MQQRSATDSTPADGIKCITTAKPVYVKESGGGGGNNDGGSGDDDDADDDDDEDIVPELPEVD